MMVVFDETTLLRGEAELKRTIEGHFADGFEDTDERMTALCDDIVHCIEKYHFGCYFPGYRLCDSYEKETGKRLRAWIETAGGHRCSAEELRKFSSRISPEYQMSV